MRIIVVGCGIVGLCSALRLQEAGHEVEIRARELPPDTTSNVAGAIWLPYAVGTDDRVELWGRETLGQLCHWSREPDAGIDLVAGHQYFRLPPEPLPWHDYVDDFRPLPETELPTGYPFGFFFRVPIVNMAIHLDWLLRQFRKGGGRILQSEISALDALCVESDAVVHCAGLGARALADDDTVYPVRGQLVRISPSPVARFILDDDNPLGLTYILPRRNDCVLGGVAEIGACSLEPDAETTRAILARCARWVPEIARARITAEPVGLRPCRPQVRLEAERRPQGLVIHNYGHGGSGLTLAWGCAGAVRDLIGKAL